MGGGVGGGGWTRESALAWLCGVTCSEASKDVWS